MIKSIIITVFVCLGMSSSFAQIGKPATTEKDHKEANPESNVIPILVDSSANDAPLNTNLKATEKEALVIFTVADPNNVAEQGAVIKLTGTDTVLTREGVADIEGKWYVLLPKGKSCKIVVEKFGKRFIFNDLYTIPKDEGEVIMDHVLTIKVITKYIRIFKMDHVIFESGKSDLRLPCIPALEALFKTLSNSPTMVIEIAGHTDNVGDDNKNMVLSQERSNVMINYLIKKGIAANRVSGKGYGETQPIDTNDTPEGRTKNRRSEVKVIKE